MKTVDFYRKLLFLLAALLFISLGCALIPPFTGSGVPPSILPPAPSPTFERCSEAIPGLEVQIVFGKRDPLGLNVTFSGAGFQPGEKITVRVSGESQGKGQTIETRDLPVAADGTFSNTDTLALPGPNMLWELRIIHQRGIACLRFVTP